MTEASSYLIALYAAELEREAPISPGRVADELGKSPAATTEMFQRLEDRDFVTYEPYDGATLTDEGRAVASDLHETYRTLSRFCRDVLGLDEYDEEALQLAGTVSPTVADRLASTLLGDADQESTSDGRRLSFSDG